eukprot:18506-Heterococcus_DN1.PRE.2
MYNQSTASLHNSSVAECLTERDVFKLLKLEYRAPHERSIDERHIQAWMSQKAPPGGSNLNILAALFAAGSAQHVRGTDMCAVAFDNKQQTGLQAITELRYAAAIYTIQHQQAMYTIATALNVYMKPHICCTSRLSAASHSAKQQ